MIRFPSRLLLRNNASAILMAVFGGLKIITILGIVILIITLDWFTNTINDLLTQFNASSSVSNQLLSSWDWIKLLAFPLFLLFCIWHARKAAQRLNTVVIETPNPRRVRALVLFLSLPGNEDQSYIEQIIEKKAWITNKGVLEQFHGPWRMPLEAIAYHLYDLKRVVVIATEGDKGTLKYFEQFKSLVHALTSEGNVSDPPRLEVRLPQDLGIEVNGKLESDSFKELNAVVNDVFAHLNENEHVKPKDIIVDVTGGTKICSIAGAVVSLGKGKRFQYVSREDYTVKEYDVTIQAEGAKH